MRIVRKTPLCKPTEVFDFTVRGDHHYLLANGVVSHNSYVPTKDMGGGQGLKYNASTIVYLSKRKDKDDSKNVVGAILRCRLGKSRITKEEQVVEVKLNFDSGLSRYPGLLEIAEEGGVVAKEGNKYKFPNGKKAFATQIEKDPEEWFTPDVIDAIEKVAYDRFRFTDKSEAETEGKDEE